MVIPTMENFKITIFRGRAPTSGKTVANSKEIGLTIRYKGMASLHGLTVASTKANTSTTKKMDKVRSTGRTVVCIKEAGRQERWMERAPTSPKMAKFAPASGKKVRGYTGSMSRENQRNNLNGNRNNTQKPNNTQGIRNPQYDVKSKLNSSILN